MDPKNPTPEELGGLPFDEYRRARAAMEKADAEGPALPLPEQCSEAVVASMPAPMYRRWRQSPAHAEAWARREQEATK